MAGNVFIRVSPSFNIWPFFLLFLFLFLCEGNSGSHLLKYLLLIFLFWELRWAWSFFCSKSFVPSNKNICHPCLLTLAQTSQWGIVSVLSSSAIIAWKEPLLLLHRWKWWRDLYKGPSWFQRVLLHSQWHCKVALFVYWQHLGPSLLCQGLLCKAHI